MLNPDGRDRYVTWYKSSQTHVLNADVNDLEHDEICLVAEPIITGSI